MHIVMMPICMCAPDVSHQSHTQVDMYSEYIEKCAQIHVSKRRQVEGISNVSYEDLHDWPLKRQFGMAKWKLITTSSLFTSGRDSAREFHSDLL